jgi:hypothetical protein
LRDGAEHHANEKGGDPPSCCRWNWKGQSIHASLPAARAAIVTGAGLVSIQLGPICGISLSTAMTLTRFP